MRRQRVESTHSFFSVLNNNPDGFALLKYYAEKAITYCPDNDIAVGHGSGFVPEGRTYCTGFGGGGVLVRHYVFRHSVHADGNHYTPV